MKQKYKTMEPSNHKMKNGDFHNSCLYFPRCSIRNLMLLGRDQVTEINGKKWGPQRSTSVRVTIKWNNENDQTPSI